MAAHWGSGEKASADMMSLDASLHLWGARVGPRGTCSFSVKWTPKRFCGPRPRRDAAHCLRWVMWRQFCSRGTALTLPRTATLRGIDKAYYSVIAE